MKREQCGAVVIIPALLGTAACLGLAAVEIVPALWLAAPLLGGLVRGVLPRPGTNMICGLAAVGSWSLGGSGATPATSSAAGMMLATGAALWGGGLLLRSRAVAEALRPRSGDLCFVVSVNEEGPEGPTAGCGVRPKGSPKNDPERRSLYRLRPRVGPARAPWNEAAARLRS